MNYEVLKVDNDVLSDPVDSAATLNRQTSDSPKVESGNRITSFKNSIAVGKKKDKEKENKKEVKPAKKAKSKPGARGQWLHSSEAIEQGQVVYNVKFLGTTEVEDAKGTEAVADAIRKIKFSKNWQGAESQKPLRVELVISLDGLYLRDSKTEVVLHKYPLNCISYCADDKSDKKVFSFIAMNQSTGKHNCVVFSCEKSAEEVTLSVGQTFDLAYRRHLDAAAAIEEPRRKDDAPGTSATSPVSPVSFSPVIAMSPMDSKLKQLMEENLRLKERVADLERLIDPAVLAEFDRNRTAILERYQVTGRVSSSSNQDDQRKDLFGSKPFAGGVTISPPPVVRPRTPLASTAAPRDPFGMSSFLPDDKINSDQSQGDVRRSSDPRELIQLQGAFNQDLILGSPDFAIKDLDPLAAK